MLDITLTLQEQVSWYISNNLNTINKGDQLSVQDWAQLYIIYKFLAAFKSATLKLKGEDATLKKVLITIDVLNLHFKETLVCCTILNLLYILKNFRRHFQIRKQSKTFKPESYKVRQNLIITILSSLLLLFILLQLFFTQAVVWYTVKRSGQVISTIKHSGR